jgi:hypothetical protein
VKGVTVTTVLTLAPTMQDLAKLYHIGAHKQLKSKEVDQIQRWVQARYEEETAGIMVVPVGYQPYARVAEMEAELQQTSTLRVSTLFNTDPVLPGHLNLKYRAAHDMVHVRLGADFDWPGELTVARQSVTEAYNLPLIQQFIFSETVLQAAHALHYGYFRGDQAFVPVVPEVIDMLIDGLLA